MNHFGFLINYAFISGFPSFFLSPEKFILKTLVLRSQEVIWNVVNNGEDYGYVQDQSCLNQ